MVRLVQLRFAAVPLIAGAVIALTTASVWALSQQPLGPGDSGNGNYNFDMPSDQAKSGQSAQPPNGSGFHFSVQPGSSTSSGGFRSFQGNSNNTAPDYYSRPLGNGN